MKNLEVIYERFDHMLKTYKLVWQKDGGDSRFTDLYNEDTILFKDIRAKVEKPFLILRIFVIHECITSINDLSRQMLDENELLWDYLEKENF